MKKKLALLFINLVLFLTYGFFFITNRLLTEKPFEYLVACFIIILTGLNIILCLIKIFRGLHPKWMNRLMIASSILNLSLISINEYVSWDRFSSALAGGLAICLVGWVFFSVDDILEERRHE